MNSPDVTQTLRQAGLRPTLGRTMVLKLLVQAGGAPRCCEDLYRSAMQTGRPLNVSSIAHALADLERVGCIERSVSKEERRPYYRYPTRDKADTSLPVFLERNGQRILVGDPLVALRLTRWLADQGEAVENSDSLVVRIERATPSAPGLTGH